MKEKEFYTKTEVLNFGFTEKLITALLPDPVLKQNPIYKSASPMKLWRCEDVDSAMNSEVFISARLKSASRREGAKKAVVTKEAKLFVEVSDKISKISVSRIDLSELRQTTLNEKQGWYNYQASIREKYDDFRSIEGADEQTCRRWMVNYIRHNLTEYDSDLYSMSGRVGCHKEYQRYKLAVLDKIAEVYPELKSECNNQKNQNFCSN